MQLQELQEKLTEALYRIQQLEERVSGMEEAARWRHLIRRPHSWRRQLSLRERHITVGQLVSTIRANNLTPEQASEDLELPLEAIQEALAYYAENRDLIAQEASEERRRLAERGYALEPEDLPR